MKKSFKKAMVFGLSAGLTVTSLAGCSKKETFDSTAAAITVDGDSVSAGVLNFGVRYNQAALESLYMQYLGVDDPFNQDLFGSGSTLGEQAKSQMVTKLTHALLAEQHMDDYDIEITDEEKEQVAAAAAQFIADNDADVLSELSITEEDVSRYLELSLIQEKMEVAMSADVDTEVSDEEAAQRRVQYVLFTPVTEDETEIETESELEAESEIAAEAEEITETEAITEAETIAETEAITEAETIAETEVITEAETAALEANTADKTKSADETEIETEAAETELIEETETETEPETEDPETVAARERAYEQALGMIEDVKSGTDFDEAAEKYGKSATDTTFGADYSITELVEATDGLEDGTLVEEPVLTSSGNYYVIYLETQLDRDATDAEKESIIEDRKDEMIDNLYTEWTDAVETSTDEDILAEITFEYHLEAAAEEAEEVTTEVAEEATEALTE